MELLFDVFSIEKYYGEKYWAFESSNARKD